MFKCVFCPYETNDSHLIENHGPACQKSPHYAPKRKSRKKRSNKKIIEISQPDSCPCHPTSEAATVLPSEFPEPDLPLPDSERDETSSTSLLDHPDILCTPELEQISTDLGIFKPTADIICIACSCIFPFERLLGHLRDKSQCHKELKLDQSLLDQLKMSILGLGVLEATRTAYYLGLRYHKPIPRVKIHHGYQCKQCVHKCFYSRSLDGILLHLRAHHDIFANSGLSESEKWEQVHFQIVFEKNQVTTRYRVPSETDLACRDVNMPAVDIQSYVAQARKLYTVSRYILYNFNSFGLITPIVPRVLMPTLVASRFLKPSQNGSLSVISSTPRLTRTFESPSTTLERKMRATRSSVMLMPIGNG